MRRFGPTQLIGGMLVAPACGHASLAERDLTSFVQRDTHEVIGEAPNIGYCIGPHFNLLPEGLYPAGILQGARRAIVVAGAGLTCESPPAGYTRHGFATPDMSVPANTYPYYAP